MQNLSFPESKEALISLRNSLTGYQTRLDVLKDERALLLREKAKHEGILDKIPVAMELTQALYEKNSGDLIRNCETVMTDAVQAVIKDNSRIGIDADASGKQIKVTVGTVQELEEGGRVLRDIMTHEGGGLTNVVTTSLRAISIVRSGQRRFMVLDEPNCWLNPAQIPVFSAIIRDMAQQAGFQIILLTHHGVQQFEDIPNINIIRMDYEGDDIVTTASHPADTTTPDIISSVTLENFGGHKSLYLPLTAGLNVVTGPSNIGKSRIIAALRAVIYGTGSQADIRTTTDAVTGRVHMEKSATVTITFDAGKVLTWTRKKSGSPIESWRLQLPGMPENDIPVVEGIACSGRNGTQWVGLPEVLNIRPIGGVTPALHIQKSVFALEDSKAMAALISVSKTSVHLSNMIAVISEKKKNAMSELRHLDKKLETVSQYIFVIESHIPSLRESIDNATRIQDNINQRAITIDRMNDLIATRTRLGKLLEVAKKIANTKVVAKPLPDIQGMVNLIVHMDDLQAAAWYHHSMAQTKIEHTPVDIARIKGMTALAKKAMGLHRALEYSRALSKTYLETPVIPDISGMVDLIMRENNLQIELWYATNMAKTKIQAPNHDTEKLHRAVRLVNKYLSLLKQHDVLGRIAQSSVPANTSIKPNLDKIEDAKKLLSKHQNDTKRLEERKAANQRDRKALEVVGSELKDIRTKLGVCPICGAA